VVLIRRNESNWRTYVTGGGLVLGLLAATPASPQQNSAVSPCDYCRAGSIASDDKPPETFWQRTTDDPVAAYTAVLAIFTAALVGVSAIQIFFLIKADKTAAVSAEAALKAAKAAIESSYLERAWVSPQEVTTAPLIDCVYDETRYPQAYGFRIVWTNSGRTPAKEVDMFIAKEKVDRGAPVPTFRARFQKNARSIIGPKMARETNFIVVPMADVQELIAEKYDLYIYSKVTYLDVFLPDQRVAEMVCRVRCDGEIVSANGNVTLHFQFHTMGAQNVCT
jgi:hypothetical protein